MGCHIAEAIDKASTYVPVAPTGAELKQKLTVVAGEIDGVMPILPLTKVKLVALNIPRYEDSGSYNNYNYLSMKMPVGDSTYTYYFTLSGYNGNDVPYFGFSTGFGTWKVVDENGNEWTGNDAPVRMGKEDVSGYSTINAVKPGVCYLKYFIDEDAYNTATDPDHFTTNDELTTTAVVKVTVTDNRTVSADGQFEGYVDEEPEALDGDGKLHAAVYDAGGKEVDADVTWEQKEQSGINLSENRVSFTKPGTYHVRACTGDIKSDWVEITAKYRTFDVTFKPGNGREEETIAVRKGQTVSAPSVGPGECAVFTGWFTDAGCTQEADLTRPVTEDMVLYGGWAAQHDLKEVSAVEADCEADGRSAHFACKDCGKLFSDAGAENELKPEDVVIHGGHQMVRTKRKASSCVMTGNIEYYTCSVCGGIFRDKNGIEELSEGDLTIPALGHKWTEWETVKEADEQAEGQETRFCLNDPEHKQTRNVPCLSHKHIMVKTLKTAPTCTEGGNILYYTCSGCGWVFTDFAGNNEISPEDVFLPAKGHTWDAGKVTKKATTTATGTKTFTCTECGATKTSTIARLPKKANPLKISPKTAKIKYKAIKKKSKTLAVTKVIKFRKKGQGTMNYTLTSAKKGSKSFKKYFKINKTTGKVTVKKKLKKGTYKVKVKVKAAGNAEYKASGIKTVTFKIKVK